MSVPYRALGTSGLKVSPLVLGTDNVLNPTPEDESIRMIHAAVAAGINLIDTADSYAAGEAERVVGAALHALGGAADGVLVATKLHYPTGPGPNDRGNSRLHVIRACEASLRRLGRDHIDLYQTHRPDLSVPLDETLGALDDLVRAGKVRYVGSTTAPAWYLVEALWVADVRRYERIVSEQSPYNLLDRRIENELVPACERHGLGILCWSPLAMGVLAGRYRLREAAAGATRAAARGGIYAERVTPAGLEIGDRFVALARETGIEPAALAALWVKDQPGITAPIVGPRTVAQLEGLTPVMELALDDRVRAACDELVPPGTAVASFFNSAPWMAARRI
jgi:aryl-alcohol dehydrogenase-like predicted oxidoreductase